MTDEQPLEWHARLISCWDNDLSKFQRPSLALLQKGFSHHEEAKSTKIFKKKFKKLKNLLGFLSFFFAFFAPHLHCNVRSAVQVSR